MQTIANFAWHLTVWILRLTTGPLNDEKRNIKREKQENACHLEQNSEKVPKRQKEGHLRTLVTTPAK